MWIERFLLHTINNNNINIFGGVYSGVLRARRKGARVYIPASECWYRSRVGELVPIRVQWTELH